MSLESICILENDTPICKICNEHVKGINFSNSYEEYVDLDCIVNQSIKIKELEKQVEQLKNIVLKIHNEINKKNKIYN